MKYKLIKLLPFENSPRIGYTSEPHLSQKDEDHYWNGLWFNPENYPEFWQLVVEKVKQPIFQTEDGVDIYESDDNTNGNGKRLYQVALCNSEDFWNDEIKPYDLVILNNHSMRGNKEDFLTFSTKEKAEEYILYNKPVLSLKEIKETTTIKGLSLKKLEKLVKQKYNSPCKL